MAFKQKCVVLSMQDKVKIINLLKKLSLVKTAENITSAISDIKRNRESILHFVFVLESEDGSMIIKIMKKAENGKAEAAIYQWFIQKRGQLDSQFQNWFCVKKA
jgi:hypothetical protein